MFARFFIDRPVFAAVLSIVITVTGGIAVFTLPITMYPPISPPTIQIDCRYPGASAETVSETVAAPIEQQVNGVEGMLYMSSQCTNDGSYNLTVTFQPGINLNMAQVLVQNRVALAVPSLPDVIKQTGLTARKRSPDILLSVNLNAPDGRYDQLFLSNYALLRVRDELARLPGVSDVFITAQRDYAMRVWVDPQRLASRNMTAGDVVRALREQNVQVAAGQVGQPPTADSQPLQMPLTALGRLQSVEQFENVIVKTLPTGQLVRVKDVARVELGAKNQDVSCWLNRKQSAGLPVWQLPDANALEVGDAVRAKMAELAKDFPDGMVWEIQFDTTPYIRESIFEVYKTLVEAIVLVALVVLLFLQSWRSAVIPLIAVPVAIIGTFAVMAAAGFTLNNLTLFGLVLAIGIVVDDAIVVVEAVEQHIEQGMSPYDATVRAMEEVSGPVIAVGLVLCAVFIPCAFITGITGSFFKQFALTIAVSTVISAFNSLTLSPALAARLLKPHGRGKRDVLPRPVFAIIGGAIGFFAAWHYHAPDWARWSAAAAGVGLVWLASRLLNRLLAWFFVRFNGGFGRVGRTHLTTVSWLVRHCVPVLGVYALLVGLTVWGFRQTPAGFVPSQDMGYLMVSAQLPDAASLERTQKVMRQCENIAMTTPGVKHVLTVSGQSFLLSAQGSNLGSQFVILDSYANRKEPHLFGEAIASAIRKRFTAEIFDAAPVIFSPPPIRGVGRAGGFKMMLEDRGALGPSRLQAETDNLVDQGNRQSALTGLFTVFRANAPGLFADVNRPEAMARGVYLRDIFDSLQIFLGSLYVNDFNLFGRTFQVIVQSDQRFRDQAEDVKRLQVRNSAGEMLPLGAVSGVRETNGPQVLTRYNMYPAAPVNGNTAPGVSSGQGIEVMESLAERELPRAVHSEWTEMAYMQLQAGNTGMIVFGFAVVMVFLVLAAQYESWSLPLAVILVVPMCLLSAITGVYCTGNDINVFTQIGFIVLVGLASKNAILIVEFAKAKRHAGASIEEAALDACRLRLRPIVMTSLAFIFGVIPLLVSTGAGKEMRRTLGTAVFGGMIGVTLFGLLLTPVFFVVIDRFSETKLFQTSVIRAAGNGVLGLISPRGLLRRGRSVVQKDAQSAGPEGRQVAGRGIV